MKLILTVALKQANKQQQNPQKDWTYINSVFLQLYNLIDHCPLRTWSNCPLNENRSRRSGYTCKGAEF